MRKRESNHPTIYSEGARSNAECRSFGTINIACADDRLMIGIVIIILAVRGESRSTGTEKRGSRRRVVVAVDLCVTRMGSSSSKNEHDDEHSDHREKNSSGRCQADPQPGFTRCDTGAVHLVCMKID